MSFISGFLGLCSAVGAGSAVEIAASGYFRQSIAFGRPVNGVSVNTCSYDFGSVGAQASVGRAIYDAPAAGTGNLLAILPHASPRLPAGGSIDRGEGGFITLIFSALAAYPDGDGYNGNFTTGTVLGLVYDLDETVGWSSTMPNAVSGVTVLPRNGQFLAVQASVLTGGVALTVQRGLLRAS